MYVTIVAGRIACTPQQLSQNLIEALLYDCDHGVQSFANCARRFSAIGLTSGEQEWNSSSTCSV